MNGDPLDELDEAWAGAPLGWITVTEQLPPIGQRVLVCEKDGWVLTAERYREPVAAGFPAGWTTDEGRVANPTHWMPLPEPPSDPT